MARRQHIDLRAPVGLNDNADLALAIDSRLRRMLGITCKHPGVLEEALRKALAGPVFGTNTWPTAGEVACIWPYLTDDPANDRVLLVRNGTLYTCTVAANVPTSVPDAIRVTMSDLTAVPNYSGSTFPVNKRVRAVQYRNEVVFVAEGGMTPLRFDGTALYLCGIATPAVPTDGGNHAGGSLANGSTYYYAVTYADSLGRESSPSALLTVTMGAGGARDIAWTAPTDPQVTRIYLYRTAAGAGTLYRTLVAGFTTATTTVTDFGTGDYADSALVYHTVARRYANDAPLTASLCTVNKDRLVLNMTGDRTAVQMSNTASPTQFSVAADPNYPTDGATFRVKSEAGDDITALGNLGSVLGIWCRKSIHILLGDQQANWQRLQVHNEGCIAPDSIAVCDNRTVFMGESAIHAVSYENGFAIEELSGDIEEEFHAVSVPYQAATYAWPPTTQWSRKDRATRAVAWYMQGRYYLAAPPYVYIYDFGRQGWSVDYMTNMPDSGGNYSGGYMSARVVPVQRQFDVVLYTPWYPGATSMGLGEVWYGSFYPIVHATGLGTWRFVYETRALDGAGVPRTSLKRLQRVRLYGEIAAAKDGGGDPEGLRAFAGTITPICDGTDAESAPFDISGVNGADFSTHLEPRGLLIDQSFAPDTVGRILQIRIEGTATGRLTIRDLVAEYVRLDGGVGG